MKHGGEPDTDSETIQAEFADLLPKPDKQKYQDYSLVEKSHDD
jgi:hypothetical protein